MTTTRFLQVSKQFGKYCEHRFTPLSRRYGLSMREINVLLFLANNPGFDTARDITEYRGISKSQVSQAVDFLTELGYLTRSADTEDRRVIHLAITQEGAPIAKEARKIQTDCGRALLEGLTAEQKHQLETLWDILRDNGERLAGEVGR